MASMQKKQKKDQEQKELLNQLKGKENVTKSGQKVNVYANIGNLADVGAVLKNDAGGIGLNFCIWKVILIQQKSSSLQYTKRLLRRWRGKRSLSVL